MVTCAMAVPANNAPTSDDAIAHRSVFIVRDLFIKREVDVLTERVCVSLAADGVPCWHSLRSPRVKLTSVTTDSNRDRGKLGLNRKSHKSVPNLANRVKNDKPCCLDRMLGIVFLPIPNLRLTIQPAKRSDLVGVSIKSPCCGRSLTEPRRRPKVSNYRETFGRSFRRGQETLAELYCSRLRLTLTRSASEVAKSLPRLRFGLVWIGTISTADSIAKS